MNVANVVDVADVDISYGLKSSEPLHNRLTKTKASLGSEWVIGIAVG